MPPSSTSTVSATYSSTCRGPTSSPPGSSPAGVSSSTSASSSYYATAARAFSDARAGDIILYEDAYENIAVAITGGSAAEMFSIRPGDGLTILAL